MSTSRIYTSISENAHIYLMKDRTLNNGGQKHGDAQGETANRTGLDTVITPKCIPVLGDERKEQPKELGLSKRQQILDDLEACRKGKRTAI